MMHFYSLFVGQRPYCGAPDVQRTTLVPELVTCGTCLEMLSRPASCGVLVGGPERSPPGAAASSRSA